MLRNDAYWFSRLGLHLERADNTARILDVKYHVLLPEEEHVGGPLDYYQWTSILRSVSALTAYHWVYRETLKTMADRRPPDPQRYAAAFAGQLLRQPGAQPRPDRASPMAARAPRTRHARGVRNRLEHSTWTISSSTACTNSSRNSLQITPGSAKSSPSNTWSRGVSMSTIKHRHGRLSAKRVFALDVPAINHTVIASQRVGAKRRPMTGSAKQSILALRSDGLLRRFAPRNDDHLNLDSSSRYVMRLRIAHSTTYPYEPPATGVIQILRMTPGSHEGKYVAEWQIDVSTDSRGSMCIRMHSAMSRMC